MKLNLKTITFTDTEFVCICTSAQVFGSTFTVNADLNSCLLVVTVTVSTRSAVSTGINKYLLLSLVVVVSVSVVSVFSVAVSVISGIIYGNISSSSIRGIII